MSVIADAFSHEPPPGFRGLQPDKPIHFYVRHLPHWRQEDATYFVTFRLGDALPPEELHALRELRENWERKHPHPRTEQDWEDYARIVTQRAENCLDKGYGACHFFNKELADQLMKSMLHYQDTRCFVPCLTVMPNHAHLIIKPFPGFELEDTLGLIKGFVARHVNLKNGSSGALWEQESYDRIIRDVQHLQRVIQYIGNNGSKAGLPVEKYRRWIHPDWDFGPWKFETCASAAP